MRTPKLALIRFPTGKFSLVLAAALGSACQMLAATLTVNNTNDNGAGSLRRAIEQAVPGATINFSVTGIITLTNGELLITKNLAIIGPGATNLGVSGNTNSRIFEISSNVTASISGLTIRDGRPSIGAAGEAGGGIYNAGRLTLTACSISSNVGAAGGGIYNGGTLTLTACTISSNSGSYGGGIFNSGTLTLTACTNRSNYGGNGGGIYNQSGTLTLAACAISSNVGQPGGGIYNSGTLTLTACTVSGNTGRLGSDGGGIYNSGILTLTACTVSGNHGGPGFYRYRECESRGCHDVYRPGGKGGGIFNLNSLTVSACTFSGNRGGSGVSGLVPAGDGGGIYNLSDLTVSACTFSGNSGGNPGGRGGGVFNAANPSSANLRSTLVALDSVGYGNSSAGGGADVVGSFTSQGHNLIGQTDGTNGFTNEVNGDLVGSTKAPLNPMLGPLQDNGGPTFTMALLPGSPALNAGDDFLLAAPFNLTTDQRGLPRKFGAHVDIGAFELELASITGSMILHNDQFRFTLIGEVGLDYTIQTSTDLVNWIDITNFVSATGINEFTAAVAPDFTRRFYRAVMP